MKKEQTNYGTTNKTSIIYDEEELLYFIDNTLYNPQYGSCPEDMDIASQVFYLMFVARTKYLTTRHSVDMKSNNQFYKAIIRRKDRLLTKIKQFDLNHVYDRAGNRIPLECICAYITLSPRDPVKATAYMMKELVELMYKTHQQQSAPYETKRLDLLALKAYHKCRLSIERAVIDVDALTTHAHAKKAALEFINRYIVSECADGIHDVVETHSGFHIYMDLSKLDKHAKKYLFQDLPRLPSSAETADIPVSEVNIGTDSMVVLPGTLQGGFPVRSILRQERMLLHQKSQQNNHPAQETVQENQNGDRANKAKRIRKL